LGIITCAIGIWKYSRSKEKRRNEEIDKAEELIEKGIKDADISSLNSGFDRLRRLR
jgi:hypothetical protein